MENLLFGWLKKSHMWFLYEKERQLKMIYSITKVTDWSWTDVDPRQRLQIVERYFVHHKRALITNKRTNLQLSHKFLQ